MGTYKLAAISPETLAEAAEGAHQKLGGLSLEEISHYLNAGSIRTAQRVAIAGTQLRILVEVDGRFHATQDGVDLAKASLDQRPGIFKKFLVRFDPFVVFAMLIMKKNALESAARKVKVIYDIPEEESTILQALRSWGLYSGILEKTKAGFAVGITEERLTEQYVHDLLQAIQSEWTARLFISSKVREYAYAYLGDEEKSQLVEALMKFGTDSEKAVQQLGKSFETFLRRLDKDNERAGDMRANGIGQIANQMKAKRIIVEQQRKLCDAIAVYRNAADHGIDPDLMKHWKIENDASLEAILLGLTTIRSIYTFVQKQELVI